MFSQSQQITLTLGRLEGPEEGPRGSLGPVCPTVDSERFLAPDAFKVRTLEALTERLQVLCSFETTWSVRRTSRTSNAGRLWTFSKPCRCRSRSTYVSYSLERVDARFLTRDQASTSSVVLGLDSETITSLFEGV